MATVTIISNLQDLADCLESTGYFASVTSDGSSIIMKDADDNLLAKVNSSGYWWIYIKNGDNYTLSGWYMPKICVSCSGGIVLFTQATNNIPNPTNQILITRNTDGDVMFGLAGSKGGSGQYYYNTSTTVISWNDINISAIQSDMRILNQTILTPIFSQPGMGHTSYSKTAFYLYAAQSVDVIGSFQFSDSGKKYYLTGWYAIEDEDSD